MFCILPPSCRKELRLGGLSPDENEQALCTEQNYILLTKCADMPLRFPQEGAGSESSVPSPSPAQQESTRRKEEPPGASVPWSSVPGAWEGYLPPVARCPLLTAHCPLPAGWTLLERGALTLLVGVGGTETSLGVGPTDSSGGAEPLGDKMPRAPVLGIIPEDSQGPHSVR